MPCLSLNQHKNLHGNNRTRARTRNRSSSSGSTSLPKNLSTDVGDEHTHSSTSASTHKSSERTYKTTHSATYKHNHMHNHDTYNNRRRHIKCSPQHYRYRYNKTRTARFNELKTGVGKTRSNYTTHNVICLERGNRTRSRTSNGYQTHDVMYPDSIQSYGEDKCLSVPPLTPMLRANSANSVHHLGGGGGGNMSKYEFN